MINMNAYITQITADVTKVRVTYLSFKEFEFNVAKMNVNHI